jgi:phytoene dehydrogenase-like protein
MHTKVLIIGAGVSGLSAGCYLQMNGFDTEILEMHSQPGGVCTAWRRSGYTFDCCIHWLMGSGPRSALNGIWRELHAVQGRRFVEWDEYVTVKTAEGVKFTLYTDPDRLEREMLRLGPEDGRLIRSFCKGITALSRMDVPVAMERMRPRERVGLLLRAASAAPALLKWGRTSIQGFIARLKSPVLREAMGLLYGDSLPDFPATGMLMMLGFMHKGANGYPVGGSREFARAIERRYRGLGGRVSYGTRVDSIIVEHGAAVGVTADGVEHRADEIVSCADGHATLFDMLGGRWLTPGLREAYATFPVFPSLILVGLGIARDLRQLPVTSSFPLKTPFTLEDGALTVSRLGARIFSFDLTLAPPGSTAVTVMMESRNLPWWEKLRAEEPERYAAEKKRIGELVVGALDAELGNIAAHVEVVDVATPATWHRYTGNWQGSYEGFLPSRKTMMKGLDSTLPGLSNFSMHGQWVSIGGGIPPAGMGGRSLAKRLCRKYGKRFTTTEE